MIIVLSQRITHETRYHETRDALSHDWYSYIEELGGIPVAMPNNLNDVSTFLHKISPDYLILTGGESIEVNADGKHVGFDGTPRDRTEQQLLNYAIRSRIPVLGVCRGMQMIQLFFGGRLTQVRNSSFHMATQHDIEFVRSLGDLLLEGTNWQVNSFHQWGISHDALPSRLEVFAICSVDDSIEGIYHLDYPILGVMWHPERNGSDGLMNRQLMNYFFKMGGYK